MLCACANVYVPPTVCITAVCALQGNGDCVGEGEREALALLVAGVLGERLGLSPRVGETEGETEGDAETDGETDCEQMGPPGQPQMVTPESRATGALMPSRTAEAMRSFTGGPVDETSRLPPPSSVSSATVRFEERMRDDVTLTPVPSGEIMRRLAARVPQSTQIVPLPPAPEIEPTRHCPVTHVPP